MEQSKKGNRAGSPTIVVIGLVVFAFMGLSLVITATGTARFAAAMGYSRTVGYVVGAIFDIAKDVLLVAVLALWARRALGISIILRLAWIGLVTYSVLATHATISTAISAIEQSGAWKMEGRANVQAELKSVEQQLDSLSHLRPPRPAKTVRAALAAARVPPGIWRDSRECAAIQESAHFAKECAQVVQLRTELTTAEDYEHLSARANELRKSLAKTPIVATSDALPAAFTATLGRLLPVDGTEGVALLLTMVVEIMSCFGLAALRALYNSEDETAVAGRGSKCSLAVVRHVPADTSGRDLPALKNLLPEQSETVLPASSPMSAISHSKPRSGTREERAGSCSNVVEMRQAPSSPEPSDAAPQRVEEGSAGREDVCSPSVVRDDLGRGQRGIKKILPQSAKSVLPISSLVPDAAGHSKPRSRTREESAGSSSNVVQMKPAPSSLQRGNAAPQAVEGGSAESPCTEGSRVPAFLQARLRNPPRPSIGATDLRDAYISWCTEHGYTPLSAQKLSAELMALGFTKARSPCS
jgi:hypothetical protein